MLLKLFIRLYIYDFGEDQIMFHNLFMQKTTKVQTLSLHFLATVNHKSHVLNVQCKVAQLAANGLEIQSMKVIIVFVMASVFFVLLMLPGLHSY